jgi:phosphoadenosine phosphosulfate reductase
VSDVNTFSKTPSHTVAEGIGLDLEATNAHLQPLSATERIQWAVQTFNSGLYAMTSAGVDAALLPDHIAQAEQSVPFIHINTGFLPDETVAFRDDLSERYGFQVHEFGPSGEQIEEIAAQQLWEVDMARYGRVTKLEPLSRAINRLGVVALLSGVRGDQTENRATLDYVGTGNDGELRVHPFIDWSTSQVTEYITRNGLPRNPLYYQGFESVGDWHATVPGKDRSGRTVVECGLHTVGGTLIQQAST